MDNFNHHGSIGNCYSTSNNGCYQIRNKLYVGVYATKKSKNPGEQGGIDASADGIKQLCATEISDDIHFIGIIIPNMKYDFSSYWYIQLDAEKYMWY